MTLETRNCKPTICLKSQIRFDRVNLSDDSKMLFQKGIDVIFCCNVLIYFDLASKRRVVQHFYSNLLPGGYLFLGHAESLFQVDDSFRLVHFPGTTAYWKPTAAKPVEARNERRNQQRTAASQIKNLNSISTAPAILKPLLDMLRLPSEDIRVEKVVELVSYDGAIAAQCLRLANSPLFGRRQTETVRGAVMALGLERSTLDVARVVRESGYPAGQVGDRAGCVLAALARLRFDHAKDGEENRISGARKGLSGWTCCTTSDFW